MSPTRLDNRNVYDASILSPSRPSDVQEGPWCPTTTMPQYSSSSCPLRYRLCGRNGNLAVAVMAPVVVRDRVIGSDCVDRDEAINHLVVVLCTAAHTTDNIAPRCPRRRRAPAAAQEQCPMEGRGPRRSPPPRSASHSSLVEGTRQGRRPVRPRPAGGARRPHICAAPRGGAAALRIMVH